MMGAKLVAPMNNNIGSVASKGGRSLSGRLLPKPIGFDNLNAVNDALPLNLSGLVGMKRNASAAQMPMDRNFQSKRTRRRERHNNTELRRMAKIRQGIEGLKEVMELDGVVVKGSKADILSSAVRHMRGLQAIIYKLRGGRNQRSLAQNKAKSQSVRRADADPSGDGRGDGGRGGGGRGDG